MLPVRGLTRALGCFAPAVPFKKARRCPFTSSGLSCCAKWEQSGSSTAVRFAAWGSMPVNMEEQKAASWSAHIISTGMLSWVISALHSGWGSAAGDECLACTQQP